jgi:acetylornithine deacetylase/succinyl-diaminopimelate desuccinylase
MKGPLSCMMIAMAALKRAGIKPEGDILFAAVIDEEDSSLGTQALLQSGLKPDAAVVGEPTSMEVCIGHKGVEWFETVFEGKAVHAGRPEEGINAIQKAAAFIGRIESDLIPKLKKRVHPVIGESTLNYGFIKGGTQPSTVAGECVLQIGRRWIPSERYEDVVADFQQIIDELKREDPAFRAVFGPMEEEDRKEGADTDCLRHEPMETDPDHPIVCAAQKSIKEYYGRNAEPAAFEAWSDGGLLCAYGGIPSIVFGPGSLTSAHTPDEFIEISELFPAAVVYALTALEFCGTPE